MKHNIGCLDRSLRLIAAIALFSLFFVLEGNARYIALVGIIPFITAVFRFCPAYCIFGTNTGAKTEGGKNKCCGGGVCKSKDNKEPTEEDSQ